MFCVYTCLCAGDPHASERIGPSCSRTQVGISVSQLVAAAQGAQAKDVTLIQVGGWGCVQACGLGVGSTAGEDSATDLAVPWQREPV